MMSYCIHHSIQNSRESIAALARRYDVTPTTVAKWKKRQYGSLTARSVSEAPGKIASVHIACPLPRTCDPCAIAWRRRRHTSANQLSSVSRQGEMERFVETFQRFPNSRPRPSRRLASVVFSLLWEIHSLLDDRRRFGQGRK